MFRLKNITKKYNQNYALNDISLSIGKGMNFIIGASGSGKTTLLKIITGMESDFDGEVYYDDKNIKKLNKKERSYFYNNIFGFIWQDFNLLENLTVVENILLPSYLKDKSDIKYANKLIRDLKLKNIENKQVKYLSGGQKQRVAIARELMKRPQVILADEPTSALDKKSSDEVMRILRDISKISTVIIVTHDTSFITTQDSVYELDKGELISENSVELKDKVAKFSMSKRSRVPMKQLLQLVKTNIIRNKGRFIFSVLALILSTSFLLTTVSRSINNNSQSAFDELFETYGDSLLDIGLYNSFTSAAGTDGNNNDEPDANVNQDISGLYEKYRNDERVSLISYLQAFDDIEISVDNKNYQIQSSGSIPVVNKMIVGRMPEGSEKEVVVPENFVKSLGIYPENVLDKEITFTGNITKWNGNNPSSYKTSDKVKVVGVMDTTMKNIYEGKKYDYVIEDSFLFSKSALSSLLDQADMNINEMNILMRAKTPKDMIDLKNEMNGNGIVPIGRFELLEDIVKVNSESAEQSSTANIVIALLSIVTVIAIFMISGILRKKEYAIFKISGYSNSKLRAINAIEIFSELICGFILMIIVSPILNKLILKIFSVKIITTSTIGVSLLLLFGVTLIGYILTEIICESTNITKILRSGEK
ncbi:MAG: ATP-binding cassette domain-containing protein [Clostridium sp.]|uniref:ABC transporter ATP-binding protein/permease n=1 Tax=Clostridium sp. TaxID=1506 RepID=UPI003F40BCED